MAAIMNGIALHGGFIPYGGTFLTFSDYSRNAIRMAALMKLRVIHVFTHDSIGLGEDGPTHQSVEHASSLRLIPNLDVWRPCDTVETAVAWTARARAARRTDGAAAVAPEPAVRAARRRADRRDRARRLRAREPGAAGPHAHRRSRPAPKSASRSPRRRCSPAEGIGVRVVSMPSTRDVRSPGPPNTATACCRPACRGSRSRPARPRSGGSTCAAKAAWSASIASANRRRAPQLFEYFGFTPERVADVVRRCGTSIA